MIQTDIVDIILRNLLYNEDYLRHVVPFLKTEYFEDVARRVIFETTSEYLEKYNNRPTKEALIIEVESNTNINQETLERVIDLATDYHQDSTEKVDIEWLLDNTEEFCKKRSLHIAMAESISIMGGDSEQDEGAIPDLLTEALSVSFDTHIGHDYIEDVGERWDFYNKKENRIPFDLDYLNKITKGGVPNKTLNILMGGPGTFKSGAMCHFSAHYMMQGKNVLYITLEMAEERIAERIDANLLDVSLNVLEDLPKPQYEKKVQCIKDTTIGKLIIKEYPTSSAHVGHFRYLLKDLKLKKKFKPDVIMIDYLNICASSRIKAGGATNSYTLVKSIAEEVRGLAVEYKVPIWSATQINREGFGSTDVDLGNVAESFGLPATADLFLAIIQTDEMAEMNQLMFKQLKNRYNDVNYYKKFIVGCDKSKMRLYDLEDSAQKDIVDAGNQPKEDNNKSSGFATLKI